MTNATNEAVEATERIIERNEALRSFWTSAHGWAPSDAADLLAKARLDRQVALSHTLKIWLDVPLGPDKDGRLLLAWVNLGILVEGSIKTFLSVYLEPYRNSTHRIRFRGKDIDPDEGGLEQLRAFMRKEVWTPNQVKHWDPWTQRIQQRRNAVHAFKDRDIGTFSEFYDDVVSYDDFVRDLDGQLPYPD